MPNYNHKFVEFHAIGIKPPHKRRKMNIRSCVIESVAEADEEHLLVGGASTLYVNGGQQMFVVVEDYDEIMTRIASAEKELV